MGNKQSTSSEPMVLNFRGADDTESILALPVDIWIRILCRHLPIGDIIALSRTCAAFYNLIRKTPDFWMVVANLSRLEQEILLKCFKFSWSMTQRHMNLRQWSRTKDFLLYTCKKILLTSSRVFYDEIARRDNVFTDVLTWLNIATASDVELCQEISEWGFWELFNPQHPSRIQPLLWVASPLYPVTYLPAASLLCNMMFRERTTDRLKLQLPESVDMNGYIQKAMRYAAEGRELVMDFVGIFTLQHKDITEKSKSSVRPKAYEVELHARISRQAGDRFGFSGTGTDEFAGEFTFTGYLSVTSSTLQCEKVYTVGSTEWGGHPRSGPFIGRADDRGLVGLWGAFRYTQYGAFRVWPKKQLELLQSEANE